MRKCQCLQSRYPYHLKSGHEVRDSVIDSSFLCSGTHLTLEYQRPGVSRMHVAERTFTFLGALRRACAGIGATMEASEASGILTYSDNDRDVYRSGQLALVMR